MKAVLVLLFLIIFQATSFGQNEVGLSSLETFSSKVLVLLVLGIAGTISYVNWHRESGQTDP